MYYLCGMKQREEVRYPVGIQSFAKLREEDYVYVDKTAVIYNLIRDKGYYFLSRPRRFGKSLLLSTLEAYYQGRRDLFKGLALDSLTDEWEPRPVFHLDLNNGDYTDSGGLLEKLDQQFSEWEKEFGISGGGEKKESVGLRFGSLIKKGSLQTGRKVVILIDEYDKPLLNAIHQPELADLFRAQLKVFYSNLKTMDPYIEMAVLTGVARFSKVSIFSDLNNLRDISFSDQFSAICGITSEELDTYFQPGISTLAEKMNTSAEEIRGELRKRYEGYHFSESCPDIYNPFSLVNVFTELSMSDYWFSSGTPTYLVRLIQRGDIPYRNIAPAAISKRVLESAGLLNADPLPAFYQSGYLTIKDYDRDFQEYTLDYPNEEVKYGFLHFLLDTLVHGCESRRGFSIPNFVRDVRDGKVESFMKRMESLVASIPYNEKSTGEDHFQNAVYLLFSFLGHYTRMEDRTSDGRIDLQVETSRYIYIFEFKIDSSSSAAMEQIREKKYWLREAAGSREIFLIGANFDTATRRMTAPVIERP